MISLLSSPCRSAESFAAIMRTLEKPDTPILKGMEIYHNYVRPHMALNGRTPAEAAGIKVEGSNKWLTIIQNASKK